MSGAPPPTPIAGRIVLVGDSHLAKFDSARMQRLRSAVGDGAEIVNLAIGGSTAIDLVSHLECATLLPDDRFVVSVGTNDLAPWKRVPIDRFHGALTTALLLMQPRVGVLLVPPPSEMRAQVAARPTAIRTAADRAPYADAVRTLARQHGAGTIELSDQEPMYSADGVHLNDHGYDLLIDLVARALSTVRTSPTGLSTQPSAASPSMTSVAESRDRRQGIGPHR